MKKQLISFAKRSTAVQVAGRLLDRATPAGDTCVVLTFHRIDTQQPDLYPGLAGLDAADLERFADDLVGRFRPIGVDEFCAAIDGAVRLPRRSVLVTFDDAYRDFADVAWPILRERGIDVVLFVPTAYPDHPQRRFWWDDLYAAIASTDPTAWQRAGLAGGDPSSAFASVRDTIKSMPHDSAVQHVDTLIAELRGEQWSTSVSDRVLGWSELAALAADGVAIAPHSRTHPMLDRLPRGQLDDEIAGSLADVIEHLGREHAKPVFAYPSGGHDPLVRAAVERAGFAAAFTTERGVVDTRRPDRYRLARLNVGRDATVGVIAAEAAVRRSIVLARGARRQGGARVR